MAASVRNHSEYPANFTANIVVPKPTGTAENDVMVAHISWYFASPRTMNTAPSGWTLIREENGSAEVTSTYWKLAGASEPTSYTWVLNGSARVSGAIVTVMDNDTTAPIDNNSGQLNAATTDQTAPGLTPVATDTLLLYFGFVTGQTSFTKPSGMTGEVYDFGTTAGSADITHTCAYLSLSTNDPTGDQTGTAAASGDGAGILVTIKSAAAAGAVQVNLNVGDMGMTGQPVTPENRGILLGVGDMGMSGQPVTVQVGHVTVNLNVGEMGMTGQQVTPENRGVLLGVGDMGMTGLPVAVSLGKVQINLNVGDMGMTGQSAAINLIDTAVQINLNVGQMGMIGIPVSLPSRFVAIPTHHVQREFSFNLKPPLINPDAFQFRELFPQAKSYSQVNKDIGGYWSATLETEIDRRELDFWLNHALMSHLEVYAPTLDQIGEFFVNKITLSIGRLQITLGPVLDVVNKLAVAYAEMILDENGEPIIGENKYTDWQQDSASQTRYGIIEAIHNGGQLIDVLATQQAQINLAELKDPKHEESETGGTAVPHVSFDLMGYVHLLKLFTYQNNTEYDTENLSTKLTNAISADPNGIFPGTFPNVATNTTQVSKNESAARPAWTIIKELIELGDDSLNQYVFTVGNGRQITYAQIPTDIAYVKEHDSTDYRTPQNQIVQPWNVLPGRWLQYTDLLIGEPNPSTLTERARSPKFPFLKSTTFTLPDQIAYQSGEALTPSDILARRYALERSR